MRPDGAMADTVRALAEGCVTARDVAEATGVPLATVRSRLWHLKQRGVIRAAGTERTESTRNGRPPLVYEVLA